MQRAPWHRRTPCRIVSGLAIALLLLVSMSCASRYEKGSRFSYQDRVGFTKISVVAVTPWSRIAPVLETAFKLTPEEALQKAAQSGRTLDEVIANNLTIALKGNLTPSVPGQSTGSGTNSQSGNGSTDQSGGSSAGASSNAAKQQDDSSKGGSGDTGGAKDSSSKADAGNSTSAQSAPAVSAMPAMAQYQAAMSLYQEVKLIPTYVEHVAVENDAVPYFVTLDVSMFPSSATAEVNALVIIAFVGVDNGTLQWIPTVVPVMASEDLETDPHSRSVHNTLALALSLAGTAPNGMGGSGDFKDTYDELSKIAGKDVNSLQLVSSAGQNSLVVRFGASYGVKTEYALYPQRRRVHSLLWIPREHEASGALYALANATFRYTEPTSPSWDAFVGFFGADADSGAIPVRDKKEMLTLNTRQLRRDTGLDLTEQQVSVLWNYYQMGEPKEFAAYLAKQAYSSGRTLEFAAPVLWAEISKAGLLTAWSYSQIQLPQSKPGPPVAGDYLAVDDGEAVTLTLPIGEFPSEPGCWTMSANLGGRVISFLPSAVDPLPEQKTLAVKFRSLRTVKKNLLDAYDVLVRYAPGCATKDPVPKAYAGPYQLQVRVLRSISQPRPSPTKARQATLTPTKTPTKGAASPHTTASPTVQSAPRATRTHASGEG
jgi:hypothetical protein